LGQERLHGTNASPDKTTCVGLLPVFEI